MTDELETKRFARQLGDYADMLSKLSRVAEELKGGPVTPEQDLALRTTQVQLDLSSIQINRTLVALA